MSFIEVKKIEFTGDGGQIISRFAWSEFDNGATSKHLYSIGSTALPLKDKHFKWFVNLILQSSDPVGNLKGFRTAYVWELTCRMKNIDRLQKQYEKLCIMITERDVEMKEVKP